MALSGIQALVALSGASVLFALGLIVGRWIVVLVPTSLLVLYVVVFPDEGYNRIPEDWQATAFTALTIGAPLAAVGVASRKGCGTRRARM